MSGLTVRALPAPKEVRDVLTDLLGKDVKVTTGVPVTSSPSHPVTVAVYVDDSLSTIAVALLDVALCGATGGALGLLPPAGVRDMVKENDLSPMILENVHEVANVLSVVLNRPGASHTKLYRVYEPGEPLAADVRALAAALGHRLDLSVDVAGYDRGALSLVLMP